MGRAREEMHEHDEYEQTLRALRRMMILHEKFPTASIRDLERLAWESLAEDESDAELARKLDKPD